jgi:lipopolysaccharide export system protein LptA
MTYILFLSVLFFPFLGSSSLEVKEDKKEPIHIHGEGAIEIDQNLKKISAFQKAFVRKGNSTLLGDAIYGYFEKKGKSSELKKVEAFGHVKVVMPNKVAQSHEGYFDVITDIIILKGNVRVTEKENQLTGAYGRINRKTGVTEVFGYDPTKEAAKDKTLKKNRVRVLLVA